MYVKRPYLEHGGGKSFPPVTSNKVHKKTRSKHDISRNISILMSFAHEKYLANNAIAQITRLLTFYWSGGIVDGVEIDASSWDAEGAEDDRSLSFPFLLCKQKGTLILFALCAVCLSDHTMNKLRKRERTASTY